MFLNDYADGDKCYKSIIYNLDVKSSIWKQIKFNFELFIASIQHLH